MSIKTILAAASGGTATNGAIELACRVARRFGAHVEGFHAKADPVDLVASAGDGFGVSMTSALIDKFVADAAAMAAKTKAAFEAGLSRHAIALSSASAAALPGKLAASASWREETGYGPTLLARRARFFDLAVLGRSERVIDQPHSDAVEQTLIYSGRPVLLAPANAPVEVGNAPVVGWNGSPEAVRALVAALPFLAAARSVSIVTVGDKHGESAAFALDYLRWHDIAAKHRPMPMVESVGPGQQLLSAARDEGGDLLVMGAYSHMPWREYLFGGATRDVTSVSLLPLLLSH